MTWICESLEDLIRRAGQGSNSLKRTHLADLEFDILYSARLDGLSSLLYVSVDEHNRFRVDTLDPANHLLRNKFRLDLNETLDSVGLLTEDDEDHLRTC